MPDTQECPHRNVLTYVVNENGPTCNCANGDGTTPLRYHAKSCSIRLGDRDAEGRPTMWGCGDCGVRFYPACPICVTIGHREPWGGPVTHLPPQRELGRGVSVSQT